MLYVISYDIQSDKLRSKVAKELENYGRRVQYSVFECRLPKKKFQELYGKLVKYMMEVEEGDDSNILIYRLCQTCEEKIGTIGVEPENRQFEGETVIVL